MATSALVAVVVVCALVLSANAAPYQRHRSSDAAASEAMAVDGEFLVNPNVPAHPKGGYGISPGMGDWLSAPRHKRRHPHHAQHNAAADVRFQQTTAAAAVGAGAGAAAPGDELLPIRRTSHALNAYSMPMAQSNQRALNAENTPIAGALPTEPTPMLESSDEAAGQVEATHSPASAAHAAARRAGHAAAAAHGHGGAAHHVVAGSQAYEMPTQFAGTVVAKGARDESTRDPDAFFGMQGAAASPAAAAADKRAKLGKPLYDNGQGSGQFDTIEKWTHDLAQHSHVNSLHKQLLAKLHGKPLPPPKPHAQKQNPHSLRFRQQQKAARKAAAEAAAQAKAEAEAKAAAEAEAAEAVEASRKATDAAAAEAAPAPESAMDADAQEFVAFARALGEPIDPVKHSARIASAARAVAEDRLAHDARFVALRAKEAAAAKRKAQRKQAAKLARIQREKKQRMALAHELSRVKAERVALAAAKKAVAAERRKLANAARLKAAALKRARAKAEAAKAKVEKAEAEHVVPDHLLGGAVPLPAAPAPSAAAVAANPFLAHANAPAPVAATAAVPPAPAPVAAAAAAAAPSPAPAAVNAAPVVAAPAAAVPVPPPAPAVAPTIVAAAPAPPAPAAAAAEEAAPSLSAEELAMADYVGDKPVIFAPSAAAALVPNPPPAPGSEPAVEYVAPTPLSELESADTPVFNTAFADSEDSEALAIPAEASPAPEVHAVEDVGTTTYGSADDLTMAGQGTELLQTASNANANANAGLSKWKGATKAGSAADAHSKADGVSPILSCILANCSVPYLTCLSSMECSAVFDCLQTTGAPIATCAKYHARMGERDKRLFGELSDCEQQNQCFGAAGAGGLTEPATDAHTQPTQQPQPLPQPPVAKPVVPVPAPAAPSKPKPSKPAPAPTKPAKPPVRGPAKCEVVCARKCREDQTCLNACNAECFQKRYVVQL